MLPTPDHTQAATLAQRGDLVRATGVCSVCDFKFKNELVLRYPSAGDPGGWLYIEPRHLHDGTYTPEGTVPGSRAQPRGTRARSTSSA
jgi:hypothetical protein